AKKVKTNGGKRPYAVALDPSGKYAAITYDDSNKVDVYRTSDLSLAYSPNTAGIKSAALLTVAWSSKGDRLVGGGRSADADSAAPIAVWQNGGRGSRHERVVADNSVAHLLPCGNGFAVGAHDPLFALLDINGMTKLTRPGGASDMRKKIGNAF